MIKQITLALLTLIMLTTGCKKTPATNTAAGIAAHYLFKAGTYWVYTESNGNTDSLYVTATGTQNNLPYMQIHEFLNGSSRATIYIGAGPASNQLQLWGYNYNGANAPQVIFEADTPALGAVIAQACTFDGISYTAG